ncbi:hypothetical protein Tco_1100135 [Tanacetum coccineum]
MARNQQSSVMADLKFFGSTFDSTELYKHHKASVASFDPVGLTSLDDDASELGSEANTFKKGSLSIGAKRLSLMIVDPASMPCCELGNYNVEDDGE